ncbi:hypothetical protein KJ865_16295 [Myxococcota bacterium]|nr:hypothetical protein [Myxococcota bacterium]
MKLLLVFIFSMLLAASCSKSQKKEEPAPEPPVKKVVDVKPAPAMKNAAKVAEPKAEVSLKNIPVCDKYVKYVCACSKKHQESFLMKKACQQAGETYPQWKRDSAKSQEELEQTIKACQKAIMIIKSTRECDDVNL